MTGYFLLIGLGVFGAVAIAYGLWLRKRILDAWDDPYMDERNWQ